MEKNHLYFYYYTPKNFREIVLMPKSNFVFLNKKLSEIEGILITEKAIPFDKQKFSIIYKEKVEKEYSGKFESFNDYQ